MDAMSMNPVLPKFPPCPVTGEAPIDSLAAADDDMRACVLTGNQFLYLFFYIKMY